jgi:hypothetical protein
MRYIGVAHQPRAAIVPAEAAKSAILLRGEAWDIDIAAPPLLVGQRSQCDRCCRHVRLEFRSEAAISTDAAPVAKEKNCAKKIKLNFDRIEAPVVSLGPNPPQLGL